MKAHPKDWTNLNNALWTYPWDLVDEGIERVLGNVRDVAGCNAVSVASAYHNFKQLRPHAAAGQKIYIGEGGVVYFRHDPSRYGRISPVASSILDDTDVFRELCDGRDSHQLDVNAWTVIMHNTRLASTYPDAATRTAHGDPSPHLLCPAHQDSREFAVALCADLAHNYDLRIIELEAIGFLGFEHGYHHDKIGAPLGEWGSYLLGICLCDSCIERAKAEGVDADRVKSLVRAELDGIYHGDADVPPDISKTDGLAAWERDEPDFARYMKAGENTVASLVDDVADACAGSGTKIVIQGEAWEQFLSLETMATIVSNIDGLMVSGYDLTADEAEQLMKRSREYVGDKELIVGIQAHYPEIPSSDEWRAKVRACIENGATGLNFYNYGISTMSQLRGVGAVLGD